MNTEDILKLESGNACNIASLVAEGMFYRAYNRSALLITKDVHPFKAVRRHIKKTDSDMVCVGFPQSELRKWMTQFKEVSRESGVISFEMKSSCTDDELSGWISGLPVKERNQDRPTPAGDSDTASASRLAARITAFDIASSTPVECMNFIMELQKEIRG